jgi:hypothetical protein
MATGVVDKRRLMDGDWDRRSMIDDKRVYSDEWGGSYTKEQIAGFQEDQQRFEEQSLTNKTKLEEEDKGKINTWYDEGVASTKSNLLADLRENIPSLPDDIDLSTLSSQTGDIYNLWYQDQPTVTFNVPDYELVESGEGDTLTQQWVHTGTYTPKVFHAPAETIKAFFTDKYMHKGGEVEWLEDGSVVVNEAPQYAHDPDGEGQIMNINITKNRGVKDFNKYVNKDMQETWEKNWTPVFQKVELNLANTLDSLGEQKRTAIEQVDAYIADIDQAMADRMTIVDDMRARYKEGRDKRNANYGSLFTTGGA